MTTIYPYQTPEVRDLAAALFSPPLLRIEQVAGIAKDISACHPDLTVERRLWLERLDRDASPLLLHLSQRPTRRLGLYFERLWHFFLQQDPATDLIAHNLPVVDDGRTLGEFDCIYYCHQRQRAVHLELAVKYFLGVVHTNSSQRHGSAHEWLGPDCRDRLDWKLDQILQHQIQLSENSAARRKLEQLGIGELCKEVSFKGCLFQPLAGIPMPPAYNFDCAAGTWLSQLEFPAYCAAHDVDRYVILPKMKWLSGAYCGDAKNAPGAQELQKQLAQYFEHTTYPLLIAALDDHDIETNRFFITPDGWPQAENL